MTTPVALRPPGLVMRLSRLGSLHQCRLSFMRVLTRRMAAERWTFEQHAFDIDARGVGHAVYTATTPEHTYSLVAFAHDLPAEQRSDRVIADVWDATFTLFSGVPTAEDVARLRANVPVQEAGRVSAKELTLSRANRSVRLWTHVVDALAKGRQPDPARLQDTGYLMRTTAVYGSGKFGAADWQTVAERSEMRAPFQAEMLTVYLIRTFVRDLVNHMAHARGGEAAVPLDPALAQTLGIGNSTGLGMAPFLINHPVLISNWIEARETALARVRSLFRATNDEVALFRDRLFRAGRLANTWTSSHALQITKLDALRADVGRLHAHVTAFDFDPDRPWDRLYRWAASNLGEDAQELLVSLLMEPYGALVDDLVETMCDHAPAGTRIDGAMPVGAVRDLIEANFGWALNTDWTDPRCSARAWYVSAEKLEPRLGERHDEPVADYEQPLAPARDAALAYETLKTFEADAPIATVLLAHPEHRHSVRRAQLSRTAPYGEICDNTIDAEMLPIDMLRAKLSFFGATRFDPRSDRWVRICMYAGAPYPETLSGTNADEWVYPERPA